MKYTHLIFTTLLTAALALGIAGACSSPGAEAASGEEVPFLWENATIYFLLTDRFLNGDPSNDVNFGRTGPTATGRGFEGGDFQGVIRKIEEGYFDSLGVSAIWMTPFFEQIHGSTDEGTGKTYGYHGYWAKDWTRIDPNFGTEEELARLVEAAHSRGIRVIMDVVINHTGPVTEKDPVWPDEWVRTGPPCTYQDYESTVTCTLVENLPDIRTGSDQPVELPPRLLEKWESEGRLDRELAGLDSFFQRTGYPRAPRFYLIKWLTDFIRRYGIDGYRLDTAKHVEESVWSELGKEAAIAFREWKEAHPGKLPDDRDFYMVGEVYGYGISSGRDYWFGDRNVDFYSHSIDALINFQFKESAGQSYEELFSFYSDQLHGPLEGVGVLNYLSSHDDGGPFDKQRERPLEAATRLMLCPGAVQLYYGDETSRKLEVPGAVGDANLRSNMNWEELEQNVNRNGFSIREVLEHYRKLGQFRRDHPAVGAGVHRMISPEPYLFSRELSSGTYSDRVIVGLDLDAGPKEIAVGQLFEEGTELLEYYSGTTVEVHNGMVTLRSEHPLVLLGIKP